MKVLYMFEFNSYLAAKYPNYTFKVDYPYGYDITNGNNVFWPYVRCKETNERFRVVRERTGNTDNFQSVPTVD